MKVVKGILIFLAVVLVAFQLIPLIIPVPPLENTVPARSLADSDSRFIEVNGLEVHYKTAGSGTPVFILLHGFGASTFSWREVMQPLSELGTVIAYDRPAFGLTERPLPGGWEGESPYSLDSQVELLVGLMDALQVEQAILVGNSAGGTVAFAAALEYPERVQALVGVDAAIYSGGPSSGLLRFLLRTPQVNHLGPLISRSLAGERGDDFIRSAWHNPDLITADILAGYRKPLQVENWDKALWELTKASEKNDIADRLASLVMPVLVMTGDDDRIVPTQDSIRLFEDIPGSTLAVIDACGHLPQEECPQQFMDAVNKFLKSLP